MALLRRCLLELRAQQGHHNPLVVDRPKHAVIKPGMPAAKIVFDAMSGRRRYDQMSVYPEAFEKSRLYAELLRQLQRLVQERPDRWDLDDRR